MPVVEPGIAKIVGVVVRTAVASVEVARPVEVVRMVTTVTGSGSVVVARLVRAGVVALKASRGSHWVDLGAVRTSAVYCKTLNKYFPTSPPYLPLSENTFKLFPGSSKLGHSYM